MSKGLLALFLGLSFSAQADTFGVHLGTVHSRSGLNDYNPGIYWRSDSGLTVGAYYNSFRHPSAYVAQTWETSDRRFALSLGIVTGYSKPVLPLVVPSIRFPFESHSLRVSILPKPPGDTGIAGVHFSLEFPL